VHNVNAVSGDMFKHIQAEHMHRLAIAANLRSQKAPRFQCRIASTTTLKQK
jgi:hypothetical protein